MIDLTLRFSLMTYRLVVLAIAALSIGMGLWFLLKPKEVLEWQVKLFRVFRWKIEPLNWAAEIQLARQTGQAVILCGVVTGLIQAMQMIRK